MSEEKILEQLPKSKKVNKHITKSGKSKSKSKGKSGERFFVEKLKSATKQSWLRVPNSGAFIGKQNRERIREMSVGQIGVALGDIQPPDNLKFNLVLECKNYAYFPFYKILTNNLPSQLEEWIEEILYDTETAKMTADKRPELGFLLFKITRKGSFISGIMNDDYILKNYSVFTFKEKKFFLTDFENFLNNNIEIFIP